MANSFYNPSGNPATGSEGLSSLMRGEFVAIGAAFDLIPAISTTGSFSTIFTQQGNYTFILPPGNSTLATTANVATETTRATTAEGVLTTAVGTETTRAMAAEGVLTTAVGTETTRATAAEALLAPKASPPLTGTPTAPTASPGTNTTQLGTTGFTTAAVAVETARATTAEGLLAPKINPTLTGPFEARVAMAANNVDCNAGSFFTKTISGLTTLTVSNVPASGVVPSIILELTNGGAFAITWWSGMKWPSGVAPALTVSGVDTLGFYTLDGGTTWRGMLLGRAFA